MSEQRKLTDIYTDVDPQLYEKFVEYDLDNPHIFDKFKEYATQLKNAGRTRYSQWSIINKIRWDNDIIVNASLFKISNDYISLYARKLVVEYPEFKDFFQLKKMKRNRKHHDDDAIRKRIDDDTLDII